RGAIEDDGNGRRRALGGGRSGTSTGHDQVRLEPNQLGGQLREPLILRLGVAELDGEVLALDPSALAQEATQVGPDEVLLLRARQAEDTDAVDFCRLLRRGGMKRRRQEHKRCDGDRDAASSCLPSPCPLPRWGRGDHWRSNTAWMFTMR